jgi:CubicO group peptidase (beta-lactamase class C family)
MQSGGLAGPPFALCTRVFHCIERNEVDLSSLSEAIRQTIATSQFQARLSSKAGAVLALIRRESIDVIALGAGVTAITPMEVGSLTKVFTALLVAEAIRRQEIRLSTRIDELLFGEHWTGSPAINVQQLATHTSGLPRVSFPFWKATVHPLDPYRKYTHENLMNYLRRKKPRVPNAPTVSYSNFGYAVLGVMLEKAASKAYEQLLRERVLDPLEMKTSGLHLTGEPDRASKGRRADGRRTSVWHQDAYAPCGALVCTLTDLISATRAFLDPANSIAEALNLTTQPRAALPGGNIGLGWILPSSGNSFWHNGATGGYCSYLGIYKPNGIGLVIIANQALPEEATQLGHHLMRVIAQNG